MTRAHFDSDMDNNLDNDGLDLPRTPTGVYRAIPRLNWGTLKHWRISPLHGSYFEITAETDEDTDDLQLGRAFHVAALEPDTFEARYAKWTGGRRSGGAWDNFCDEHPTQEPLTADMWERAHGMAKAVREHPAARPYFRAGGEVEAVRQWTEAGIPAKARLDRVPFPAVVLDLKSALTIHPRGFAAAAWDRGYFHQGSWYRRAQANHIKRSRDFVQFILIAVEKRAPFDVAVYPVAPATLDYCDEQIDELLKRRAACKASGVYPGAYPDPVEIGAPAWAVKLKDPDGKGFEIVPNNEQGE